MKRRTLEWIEIAEGDWLAGQRELAAPTPVCHVVCFLAQQCAEKCLKAFLEEQQTAFKKDHDLVALLDLGGTAFPELDPWRPQLSHLGTFGIAVRYPGPRADMEAATRAMSVAREVRGIVRTRLGLPTD